MKPANPHILAVHGGSSSIQFTRLSFLGIELNETRRNAETAGVISTDTSRVAVRVIRTDEELMIARSVCRVLGLGVAR